MRQEFDKFLEGGLFYGNSFRNAFSSFSSSGKPFSEDEEKMFFYENFLNYFRENIIGSISTSDIFLSDDEKTFQYSKENTVEVAAEYDMLINKNITSFGKVYYAERGGKFCVILPALNNSSDREYYSRRARQFYRTAFRFSENMINVALYKFMSRITLNMTDSLERILTNIKKDGEVTYEDYGRTIALYWTGTNKEKNREHARTLIQFADRLNIDRENIPLKPEHMKYL